MVTAESVILLCNVSFGHTQLAQVKFKDLYLFSPNRQHQGHQMAMEALDVGDQVYSKFRPLNFTLAGKDSQS